MRGFTSIRPVTPPAVRGRLPGSGTGIAIPEVAGGEAVPKSRQAGFDFIDALPSDGERKLMLAVLIDAIRTLSQELVATHGANRHAWLQDQIWVSTEDHSDPFSFINICAALGLSAGYVRRCIRALQQGSVAFRVHRYAAKVEDSWERQRAGLSQPRATHARRRAKVKRLWPQPILPAMHIGPLLLEGTHGTSS